MYLMEDVTKIIESFGSTAVYFEDGWSSYSHPCSKKVLTTSTRNVDKNWCSLSDIETIVATGPEGKHLTEVWFVDAGTPPVRSPEGLPVYVMGE